MTWWQELIRAGAVPGSGSRSDEPEAVESAELVEGGELQAHPVPAQTRIPNASFLNGMERWGVRAYDGVIPLVDAYIAAAVRRRDERGILHTTAVRSRSFAVAAVASMTPALRESLEGAAADIEPVDDEFVGQPARYLEQVESIVRRARAHLERELAEAAIEGLGTEEWLVLDGRLSRSPGIARHPRALGVIKSHGAQFLEGRGLERALTLPAGHRTSVFAVRGGHTRTETYSWYLRLWPWEGNDLLYGLLRIEARAHADTVTRASEISACLWGERAPLATPAARWDRLLYPLHQVEEYLKALAPRELHAQRAARLPRTGT
ncbi:MAG: hypothetical protein ACM358_01675 [Gemmatimonadota bacterium]